MLVSSIKVPVFALLLAIAVFTETAFAQRPPFVFANPVNLGPNGALMPYVCQTSTCAAAHPNAEVLYTKAVVNACTRQWTESITGTNQVNLSFTFTGLPAVSTHNHGLATWSPDGTWFLMQAQDAGTSKLCTDLGAGVIQGLGNGLFACKVATSTCYELAIQGNNTGHFCAPGVRCPVLNALSTYVDDQHGVLFWRFTPDGSKIYGMYIMGTGHAPEAEKLNGTLRWATIDLTSTPPVLSAVTETDVGPLGTGDGTKNWYEGAGALPTSVESVSCTVFATGVADADGALKHTRVLQYNLCTGAHSWIGPGTNYQEFFEIRPQGDIGAGSSSVFLPPTLPYGQPAPTFISGPSDLAFGPATAGKVAQATFYNEAQPNGYPCPTSGTCVSSNGYGSWDWTGTLYTWTQSDMDVATHAIQAVRIMQLTLVAASASLQGDAALSGSATIK